MGSGMPWLLSTIIITGDSWYACPNKNAPKSPSNVVSSDWKSRSLRTLLVSPSGMMAPLPLSRPHLRNAREVAREPRRLRRVRARGLLRRRRRVPGRVWMSLLIPRTGLRTFLDNSFGGKWSQEPLSRSFCVVWDIYLLLCWDKQSPSSGQK